MKGFAKDELLFDTLLLHAVLDCLLEDALNGFALSDLKGFALSDLNGFAVSFLNGFEASFLNGLVLWKGLELLMKGLLPPAFYPNVGVMLLNADFGSGFDGSSYLYS